MYRPKKINGLQLQTSLSARTDAKGISGALTNRDEFPASQRGQKSIAPDLIPFHNLR